MSNKLHRVTRRSALALVAAFLVLQRSTAEAESPAILVHQDPNCSCCAGWVRHLKDAGFGVRVEETTNLRPVRKRLGVPADLAACHTAEVDGYVLEGHVPAAAVRRLLEQRPQAVGLAVPGMPVGSPGMEGEHLSATTSFSSVRMADNPLCTLSARKVSDKALGLPG